MGKGVFTISVVLLAVGLMFNPLVLAAGTDTGQQEQDDTAGLYAQIIDFVVQQDPSLQSQQEVMEAARKLNTEKTGEEVEIPAYAQSSLRQREFDSTLKFQQAQQNYLDLKRKLVSEVFDRITELFTLQNKIENQQQLHILLTERKQEMERQVQAGIVDPGELRALSEKIISVKTTIDDARDKVRTLKMETAFNYGGQDWQQLLNLLEHLDKSG